MSKRSRRLMSDTQCLSSKPSLTPEVSLMATQGIQYKVSDHCARFTRVGRQLQVLNDEACIAVQTLDLTGG